MQVPQSAGYFFLQHCFCLRNILSVNSSLLGTFVITLALVILFFARFIDGITRGNISAANAYLADVSSNENTSSSVRVLVPERNFAGSFGSLASVMGLTVGGILYHFLGGSIFLISAAVIFTVVVASFRLLQVKKDQW